MDNRAKQKLESLKYHGNLSSSTVEKMSIMRGKVYSLAEDILSLGDSRETAEAFTHLETCQMFINKHLCMIDPQAIKEDIRFSNCLQADCLDSETEGASTAA